MSLLDSILSALIVIILAAVFFLGYPTRSQEVNPEQIALFLTTAKSYTGRGSLASEGVRIRLADEYASVNGMTVRLNSPDVWIAQTDERSSEFTCGREDEIEFAHGEIYCRRRNVKANNFVIRFQSHSGIIGREIVVRDSVAYVR